MNAIKPIRTEENLDAALARIEEIFDAPPGSPEDDELAVLLDLVELYESKHHPIDYPDPIAAIEFRMEQSNLTPRDLVPFIGSRPKVSEVLAGKRSITMSMARALHHHLGIPADVLLQEPGAKLHEPLPDVEFARFPLRAMAKRGWIPNVPHLKDRAEELVTDLMGRAGGREFAAAPLYRKNDGRRINAKTDEYALRAWCWQVLAQALERQSDAEYDASAVDDDFLREVAKMSVAEDGPVQARDFLAQHGISLEYVRHLPRTHLDAAALLLRDGRPVIGMTLRYDRIDNFWFTLMHELAHVSLHMGRPNGETGFVDDLSLRGVDSAGDDNTEEEADELAQDSLIPQEIWDDGTLLDDPRPIAVMHLASEAQVHPSIVAGRVRYESGNYRLLSQLVGTGEVRRQFAEECA